MDLEAPLSVRLPQVLVSSVVAVASFVMYHRFRHPANQPLGEKLGVETSNLDDEFSYGTEKTGECRVKSLWIYPLKSCRGVELQEVRVNPTGFEYDREFMLAEYQQHPKTGDMSWNFLTQRNYPKMALIATELHIDRKSPSDGTLSISFPLKRSFPFSLLGDTSHTFHIPLSASDPTISSLHLHPVVIWKDTLPAHDLAPLYSDDLSLLRTFLQAKGQITLFRVCSSKLREVYRCAPRADKLGYQSVVGFTDAYPLHLLNLASVRDVNAHVAKDIEKLSVKRFRANIICTLPPYLGEMSLIPPVSGPKAFDEDDWKVFSVGGQLYHAACRTVRCKLPNVDPDTGERDINEPDQTMRKYRSIDAGCPGGACLGMQVVPTAAEGTMKVGDTVEVQERGEHFYIKQ